MLIDNHGREINYMRIAVTDRCNLRCFYCMPENGIEYVAREELLTFEEWYRLIRLFAGEGISKLRITGGEPFVRRGIMDFLREVSQIEQIKKINITTNGTLTEDKVPELEKLGIKSINLSLDSLNKERFYKITRRDMFDKVMNTFHAIEASSIDLKINMVVMDGRNIEDIYDMIELTKDKDVAVRFIEEMPFNGTLGQGNDTIWPMQKILSHIDKKYTYTKLEDEPNATARNYKVDGYRGSFGIIAAYTRTFCGTCNRIRLTPQGTLRTCLYGQGILSFRELLRSNASDSEILDHLKKAIGSRAKDGFEAEKQRTNRVSESMATIGG